MNWLEIVKVIGPLVLQLIPALHAVIHPVIVKAIVDAEQTGKSGPEKLKDVLSLPDAPGYASQDTEAIIKGVGAVVAIANAISEVNTGHSISE